MRGNYHKNGYEDGALGYFIWRIIALVSLLTGILALLYLRNFSSFTPATATNEDDDSTSVVPTNNTDPSTDESDNTIDYVSADIHGYYYDFLSQTEQTAYDDILGACMNYETSIVFKSAISKDEMVNAESAFGYDHPEYYWTSGTYTMTSDGNGMVTALDYEFHGNEESVLTMIYQMADEIISGMPRNTEYDAYKYLYDYIIDNTIYDAEADVDNQNVTSVFFDKVSVCAGYSKAFKLLCDRAGLDCVYVTGNSIHENGESEAHAWNFVRINNQAYWIDVTWGDPVFEDKHQEKNYRYFFATDDLINREHTLNAQINENGSLTITYPSCTDDSYDYYVRRHSYFPSYNRDEVSNYITSELSNGNTKFEMRFANETELQNAIADLIDQSAIYTIVNSGSEYYNSYTYSMNKVICVLEITMGG